jgi:hypothetical protein
MCRRGYLHSTVGQCATPLEQLCNTCSGASVTFNHLPAPKLLASLTAAIVDEVPARHQHLWRTSKCDCGAVRCQHITRHTRKNATSEDIVRTSCMRARTVNSNYCSNHLTQLRRENKLAKIGSDSVPEGAAPQR